MTLSELLATWRGLTLENRLHRLAVLGLMGTNLVTAVALLRADHTVVLVPPVFDGQVSVAREQASREVKEAWALFVAELLGNLSLTPCPRTAVLAVAEKHVAPPQDSQSKPASARLIRRAMPPAGSRAWGTV